MDGILGTIGDLWLVVGVLTGLAVFAGIWLWAIYERGIVLGGTVGLALGLFCGWLAMFLAPVLAPVLWFNRKKLAYFVHISLDNVRARHAEVRERAEAAWPLRRN